MSLAWSPFVATTSSTSTLGWLVRPLTLEKQIEHELVMARMHMARAQQLAEKLSDDV